MASWGLPGLISQTAASRHSDAQTHGRTWLLIASCLQRVFPSLVMISPKTIVSLSWVCTRVCVTKNPTVEISFNCIFSNYVRTFWQRTLPGKTILRPAKEYVNGLGSAV